MSAFKLYTTVGLLLACVLLYAASGAEECAEKAFTNSIGMKFVQIAPGTFTMGFDKKEPGGAIKPEHIPRKYLKSGSAGRSATPKPGNYDESPRHGGSLFIVHCS